MQKSVVLTGASSGIGLATAKLLAAERFHVFAGVRRADDARRLIADLGEAVTPLLFDLEDGAAIAQAAQEVTLRLGDARLVGLVNNAGVAFPAPLLHLPPADFRRQLEINVVGQLAVTQAFAPLLRAHPVKGGKSGRIVMMSSAAGRVALPFLGAYAASKHALEALSDALRRELLVYGVDVVVIEPGPIATPIWDKAEDADISAYLQTDFGVAIAKFRTRTLEEGRNGLPPEQVARAVLRALTARHPPARIALMRGKVRNWIAPRLLPDRVLDYILAAMLGLRRS